MRILYTAIDQAVPSSHGGAVHVTAVAEGLAALGHDVHVLVSPGEGTASAAVHWTSMRPPFGRRQLRLARTRAVTRQARQIGADVVMERYYNFGGEGLIAARRVGALAVLEVNAPVVDYPGSAKARLDRWLVVRPLERWRNWQCRVSDLIVTPTAKILPRDVITGRILEAEWGGDVDRFRPDVTGPVPFSGAAGESIVVFVGAFRAWHGAAQLVDAVRRLRERGRADIKVVLIGAGPEFARVSAAAAGIPGIVLTGAVAHDAVPACLAAADVGVAPFDVARHPALAIDFFWSPLKVFEYMASGLPVVLPRIPRLAEIVREGEEGVLYDAADPGALASAIERAVDSPARRRMGAAARARVVERFSWRGHCVALDAAIRAAAASKRRA